MPDGILEAQRVPTTIACRTFVLVFALAICAISYWLWRIPLDWYLMKLDDFDYLDRSRSVAVLSRHLFTPHYGHVVPLFRLETYLLFKLAGSLEALPYVLGWASFATLVLATLLSGHVVAHETGRPDRGVAAMAAVGFSSVWGAATNWYSASQALACGTMILAMLAALQLWRVRGDRWPLLLGLLATMAAPLFWTVGYIAGLVGAAYLLADGRRRFRRAAILPLSVSVATCVLVRWVLVRFSADAAIWAKPRPMDEVYVGPAITHAAQALCEFLLKNLGLDASTTDSQAIVIVPILAGLWFWTRGRFDPDGARTWPRINPLEAAGAVMMAASLGDDLLGPGYDNGIRGVRLSGWYDVIPDLGAVLFAVGWWAGPLESPPPRVMKCPERRDMLVTVLICAVILVLQMPRVERVIFRYHGLGAPQEPDAPVLPVTRTPTDLVNMAREQRQFLAKLDRMGPAELEAFLSRAEADPSLLRGASLETFERGVLPRID